MSQGFLSPSLGYITSLRLSRAFWIDFFFPDRNNFIKTVYALARRVENSCIAVGKRARDQYRQHARVELADVLERAARTQLRGEAFGLLEDLLDPGEEPVWFHTAHAFGYPGTASPGNELLEIRQVRHVTADASWKNQRVVITLDRLRVAKYPRGG